MTERQVMNIERLVVTLPYGTISASIMRAERAPLCKIIDISGPTLATNPGVSIRRGHERDCLIHLMFTWRTAKVQAEAGKFTGRD